MAVLARWLHETYGTEAGRVSGVSLATIRTIATMHDGYVAEDTALKIVRAVLASRPRPAEPSDVEPYERLMRSLGLCPSCGGPLGYRRGAKSRRWCSAACRRRAYKARHTGGARLEAVS